MVYVTRRWCASIEGKIKSSSNKGSEKIKSAGQATWTNVMEQYNGFMGLKIDELATQIAHDGESKSVYFEAIHF